jgi:phosphate transport system substrate-binding protein
MRTDPLTRHQHWAALVLVVASATLFASCSEPAPATAPPSSSIVLKGAGSSFSSVLLRRWIAEYGSTHPGTAITYDSVGSGEGVRRFIGIGIPPEEQVDFGASDSAMSDAQLAQTNNETLMLPVTAGCVAVVYHLPGAHHGLRLSRAAYAGIFAGSIDKWDDPRISATNPGVRLPDLPIGLVVRQESSGTTFAFTSHLSAINEAFKQAIGAGTTVSWRGDAMRGRGNDGVAGIVYKFEGTIGYVGYEFAEKLGLDIATLENREGAFLQPSTHACAAGLSTVDMPSNLRMFIPDPPGKDSYPIVTFSWALLRRTNPDARTRDALHDFFRWCLRDGQRFAADIGYVPLPPAVVAEGLRALDGT